jgi:hypothetical protein
MAPLDAGDLGLKKSTAIARALTDCCDLDGGQFFQLVEAEFRVAVGAPHPNSVSS